MSTIALTILSDVDDPAEDFVEVAARDVKTPPRGMNIGVIVSRAGNDPWLSESGWGPQPAVAQLPVAVGSAPGSKPLLLRLPRTWTQHLYPYEPIKIACPALDFEGVVAWFYAGENMPVTRDVAPARPIEAPVKPMDEPVEELSESPVVPPPVVDPPVGGPPVSGPPITGGPREKRFNWAWVALALLIVAAGAGAAFLLTRSGEERQTEGVVEASVSAPEQDLQDSMTAETAGNCPEAQRLMEVAAEKGLAEAHFRLGEAYDPSGDAQTRSVCLASDWNMELAIDHYKAACKAGHAAAPDRVTRLAQWIDGAAIAGDGSSLQLLARIVQPAIPAAKAACGLS